MDDEPTNDADAGFLLGALRPYSGKQKSDSLLSNYTEILFLVIISLASQISLDFITMNHLTFFTIGS